MIAILAIGVTKLTKQKHEKNLRERGESLRFVCVCVCFAEIGAAMETMVGAGAPASARGIDNDALFEAAESGKDGVFEDLSPEQLTKARTLRNEDDRSLLHVAASSGHTQVFFFSIFTPQAC
jgi:hypothetical protein